MIWRRLLLCLDIFQWFATTWLFFFPQWALLIVVSTKKPCEKWKWKLLSCIRLYSPWVSPDQNTGLGSCSLLQGIFPTQGLNLGFPHCRWLLDHLSHQGSPRILEWVTYPFSSGSSWSRNWTWASCITGRFFNSWATREAQKAWVALSCRISGLN